MSEETGARVCEDTKDKSPFHILLFLFEKKFLDPARARVFTEKNNAC